MTNETTGKSAFSRLTHIGMVVRDMDKAVERFTALGIGPFNLRVLPPEAVETYRGEPFYPAQRVVIQMTRIGGVELELIQPVNGPSPHMEFLEAKGEGIHHLGFAVDDLDKEVGFLTGKGSTVLLTSELQNGRSLAYLDLNAANLVVELVRFAVK